MESVIRVCKRCGSLVQRSDIKECGYRCLIEDYILYAGFGEDRFNIIEVR